MGNHIGIVLGGGGLLGDFQVGALKYLYDKHMVGEEVVCIAGTSVGAINGVILATGTGCTDRLERFWLQNVITPRDILQEEMWFEGIAPLFGKMLKGGPLDQVGVLYSLIKALWKESRDHLFEQGLLGGVLNLGDLLTNVLTSKSLYTTDILRDRLELVDLSKALRSKIALRLYAAELETGDCTCFCTTPRSAGAPTGECTKHVSCTTREQLIDAALASSALPGVFPPFEFGDKYYVDGSVREVVPFRGAIDFGGIDLIYVILCMPRLQEGGDAAAANPEDASKKWKESNLVDIALRSTKIIIDELVHNDLDYKLPYEQEKRGEKFDSSTIEPLVVVHGMTDLNIGKVKINMDQGYMCAYDETGSGNNRQECKQLTRQITSKRLEIWHLEHELIEDWSTVKHRSLLYDYYPWHFFDPRRIFGWVETNKVHTEILCDIRDRKRELKECIDKRLEITDTAESLPEYYEEMYTHWELHNWDLESPTKQPLIPTPWDRFDLKRRGTYIIPKEEPPETAL